MIEPISIDLASLNIPSLVPMMVAIVGALSIICIDLVNKNLDKSLYIVLAMLFLAVDFVTVIGFNGAIRGFFDLMLVDGISILAQAIIIIGTAFFILLGFTKQRFQEQRYPEYIALFLFMAGGFQFMVSSDSLILILVGLETASMALYVMIAMHNRDRAIEAAIKYFTMGALSTAFFAFGAMVFYALTGSVELSKISLVLVASEFENYGVILLGVVFMLGALGFKLSLVPFHLWVADVYEGSSAQLAGFISTVPKIAAFVVALRFFEIFVSVDNEWVETILFAIIVLTMTLPNLIALVQTDIKRMLAFSSISHAGFVFSAILIESTQATIGLFLYWILFALANLGMFTLLWINRNKAQKESSDNQMINYSGLIKTAPAFALLNGLFLLTLAGIPPFSVFWGKMYLISSAINNGYMILAFVMILNSAIAVYYYLRPIVYMFFREKIAQKETIIGTNSTLMLKVIVASCAVFAIISVGLIDILIETISFYVQISGY